MRWGEMHGRHPETVFATERQPAAAADDGGEAPGNGIGYLPVDGGDYVGVADAHGRRDVLRTRDLYGAIVNRLNDTLGNEAPFANVIQSRSIPAGYTYLAQLASHDLTDDSRATVTLDRDSEPRNLRSRPLQMETLYGRGSDRRKILLPQSQEDAVAHLKFRLNAVLSDDTAANYCPFAAPLRDIGRELRQARGRTPPRRGDRRLTTWALLADDRNDDQPMLSQLVMLWKWAHNLAIDELARNPATTRDPDRWLFTTARAGLSHCYRQIVVQDLLQHLLHEDVYRYYLDHFGRGTTGHFLDQTIGPSCVSRDFANAAYRVGHAMVRSQYKFNEKGNHNLPVALRTASRFKNLQLSLNQKWITDWRNFFQCKGADAPQPASAVNLVFARAFYSPSLFDAAGVRPGRGLVQLDLERGAVSGVRKIDTLRALIKTSQRDLHDAIPWLRDPRLGRRAMLSWWCDEDTDPDAGDLTWQERELRDDPPPFVYYLVEAAASTGGGSFGPLGSVIVADTFFRALELSRDAGNCEGEDAERCAERIFGAGHVPSTMPGLVDWVNANIATAHKEIGGAQEPCPLPLISKSS